MPVNNAQLKSVEAAAVACGLRVVDVCRFGFLEFLENPTATRYAQTSVGLERGTRVATIQVPITPTMANRFGAAEYCAGFVSASAVDLARIAACDFARRHKGARQ